MKILLVAATEAEISPLLETLTLIRDDGKQLRNCLFKNLNADVLITGVGMTNTAFYLGKYLSSGYDFALNLGLAGSFSENLELGTVVNIIQDHFSELGAEDGEAFIAMDQLNLGTGSEVLNLSVMPHDALALIPGVCGITVNTVHGREGTITDVFNRLHPNTESMEGAAFLLACREEHIPCAQLRAISNYVERRNRANWNIPLAIKNLNEKALEIIKAFETETR
jgi:futalosine hydrolase